MSNSYYVIASLLEKLGKIDSDFRFMALSDLLVELSKPDFVMDQSTEQKVTNAVLNSIKDSNSEVQNQAVKCIGPLTMKCRNSLGITKKVLELMDVQGSNIWDVALISLKNVMEATSQDSPSIEEILTLVLSKLIREMKKEHIDIELIDLFNLCIQRFSAAFVQLDVHEKVFEVLMMLIVSSRPVIRKRTILCMASFSRYCRVELFLNIVVTLMKLLDTVEKDKIESILNALSVMCNTDSAKMSEFKNDLFIKVLGLVKHENDQIKEACLNTFGSLVRRNLLIEPQISLITFIALELTTYDPHYNDEEEMMDDHDIMSQSSFNDSTDEEDETWKVRRASAKMLAEIAAADLLESKYDLLSKPLMDRFNERVEIVRIDVINAFRMLINSKATYIGGQESKRRKLDIGAVDSKWHQARESLAKDVDAIIILLVRQFNGCSLSTIEIGFQLLSEITQVLNGGLSTSINQLKSPIESILTHSRRDLNISATLKIKLLGFIKSVLNYHQAHTIWTFLEEISSSIIHSTLDKFYKVRFESLRLIQEIVASIHTSLQDSPMGHPDYLPLIEKLLKGSLAVLNNNEIEPEVLEQAIINCSMIIVKFTGIDSESLLKSQLLPNIINNLTMDSLRDSCLLSINDLVKSVDSIDWKPLITSIEPLLKGTSKHTSSLAVSCLVTLVSMLNDQIEIGVYEDLLNSIPYLLDNSELYLALDLLTSMVPNGYPSMKFKKSLIRDVLPKVVGMIATQSHLFGGEAFDSLIKLWDFLFQFDTHYSIYSEYVPMFIAAARSNQIRKESFSIVAKCIARGYSLPQFSSIISDLLNIIKASNTSENMLIFCLYCIGEIGTLCSFDNLFLNQLSALFDHASDEVRIASSLCLGLVSISNLNDSVNYLIREVSTNSHQRYYFVVAINELILNRTVTHQLETLAPFITPLCDLFFEIVDSLPTDAAKPLMADCIGKLSIIHPESGFKYLVGKTLDPSPKVCSLAASAFKYSSQHIGDAQYDKIIMETVPSIINLLNFDDIEVQKSSLVAIGMALRNHAHLLSSGVSDLLPLVANQTIFRADLVSVVKMGPFEKKVDNGLENRKLAFDLILSLLNEYGLVLDKQIVMAAVLKGLEDTSIEVQLLCHQLLTHLKTLDSSIIKGSAKEISGPLRKSIFRKTKDTATKQEIEDSQDLIRSSLALSVIVNNLSPMDPEWTLLISEIKKARDEQKTLVGVELNDYFPL